MTSGRFLALALSLSPLAAAGHPKGFHKRLIVTVKPDQMEALAMLDLDGGERAQLLRGGADLDGDHVLAGEELRKLETDLKTLAQRKLKIEVSSHPLEVEVLDTKVDLRADKTTSTTGLSVAVLMRSRFPGEAKRGMELVVQDESPDRSHVVVEVFQGGIGVDAGVTSQRQELMPGAKMRVRLGP